MTTSLPHNGSKTRFGKDIKKDSCSKDTQILELTIKENHKELFTLGHILRKLRSEFITFELEEKGKQEEILFKGIKDIRNLENSMKELLSNSKKDISKMKRDFVMLKAEQDKVTYSVNSLNLRISKTEKDVKSI